MSNNISKDDLLRLACEKCDLDLTRSQMRGAYDSLMAAIREALMDQKDVILFGIGTLYTVVKEAHTSRNPTDGSPVEVPDRLMGKFQINSNFKMALRGVLDQPKKASGGRRR